MNVEKRNQPWVFSQQAGFRKSGYASSPTTQKLFMLLWFMHAYCAWWIVIIPKPYLFFASSHIFTPLLSLQILSEVNLFVYHLLNLTMANCVSKVWKLVGSTRLKTISLLKLCMLSNSKNNLKKFVPHKWTLQLKFQPLVSALPKLAREHKLNSIGSRIQKNKTRSCLWRLRNMERVAVEWGERRENTFRIHGMEFSKNSQN